MEKISEKYGLATGLVLAAIYGAGWFIQHIANSRLGVGSIAPSRESAIATGVALVLYILPVFFGENGVVTNKHYRAVNTGSKSRDRFVKLAGAASFYCVLSLITVQSAVRPWWMFFGIAVLFAIMFVAVPMQIRTVADFNPSGVYQLILLVIIYALLIAPRLKPVFGGYALSRVQITSETKEINGTWLLVTSDSEAVVLSRLHSAAEFWDSFTSMESIQLGVVRVPWSEIKMMEALSPRDDKLPAEGKKALPQAFLGPATPVPSHTAAPAL